MVSRVAPAEPESKRPRSAERYLASSDEQSESSGDVGPVEAGEGAGIGWAHSAGRVKRLRPRRFRWHNAAGLSAGQIARLQSKARGGRPGIEHHSPV